MTDTTSVPTTEVPAVAPVAAPVTDSPALDGFAGFGAKLINDNTTVGKSGKVIKWGAYATVLTVFLTAIVASPQVFIALHWSIIVVIANVLLVFLNGLFDSKTKNF